MNSEDPNIGPVALPPDPVSRNYAGGSVLRRFRGLDLERCLDIFDYRAYPVESVQEQFQQHPRVVRSAKDGVEDELIESPWHSCFRLQRFRGRGDDAWSGGELMLAVILKGCGRLVSADAERAAQRGQTWLLPGSAQAWQWCNDGGDWEFLLARLPLPGPPRPPATFPQPVEPGE